MSLNYIQRGPREREVHCRCGNPACNALQDGIVQTPIASPGSPGGETWNPPADKTLDALGWVTGPSGDWFCGKHCLALWTYAKARDDHGRVVPVQRVADQAYAQRIYAETSAAAPAQPPKRR